MRKDIDRLTTRWDVLLQGDWSFVVGALIASALVGPVLLLAPSWRDIVLGSVAAIVLFLLGLERARARRRMRVLAEQLKSVASLDKLEVSDDPSAAALDRALNEAIQRTREQARILQLAPQSVPPREALRLLDGGDDMPRSIAVLAFGLRDQENSTVSPEMMDQLRDIADTVVAVAERRSALLQMQGSGTFALIFAAFSQEPAARSAKAAFDAAAELLAVHPCLHFGLSSGTGLPFTLPGAGYTVVGAPLEEAVRLYRLAASWHEYRLLCSEPVSLLLRPWASGQRTALQLTSSSAPPLPVYALEVASEVIALGA